MKNRTLNNSLNILMVSVPVTIRGPIPKLTELLVAGLIKLDHRVTLVSRWGHRREDESIFLKSITRFMDIVSILVKSFSDHFDIVYIHSSLDKKALLRDILIVIVMRLRSIPLIMAFHGSDFQIFGQTKKGIIYYRIADILLRCVSGILVDSSEEQNLFKNKWPNVKCGVAPQPICVPSEIDKNAMDLQIENDLPILLFAGRFIQDKGVLDILEAFPKVLDRTDCRLVFAGDGPLLVQMTQQVEKTSRMRETVQFKGYLDQREMWRQYFLSDVLILPTYHGEGMPTVILEAMACGLGIVCTCIRGVADYLKEGENALFVPPKRPEILTDRIIELLSNRDLLMQMKTANIELSHLFEPLEAAKRQVDIIKVMLASR